MPGRPTICHLLHSLNVGGAEVLAARLGRVRSQDCRVLFACLDVLGTLGHDLRSEGFLVEVLGRQPGVDVRCILRLRRLLRRERVDIVHAHQYTPFFYAAAARAFRPHVSVLFTEHGRHYPDFRRAKHVFVNRLLLRSRDRCVGVGETVRQALIANEGLPPERVGVIYNGIDLSTYARAEHDATSVRAELGIGVNDLVIVQVARLDYLKDHATAIRAMDYVVKQCPNARLLLVGEGPERTKIETLIQELGLADHIRLLGLRKDVARLLRAADLFLLTSISEGIPLTVIEAMASGLPVVATNVGGLATLVEATTGYLAKPGDAASIARFILRLAADGTLRRQIGSRGKDRAWQSFSEDQMHASYRRLYQEMTYGSALGKPSERAALACPTAARFKPESHSVCLSRR